MDPARYVLFCPKLCFWYFLTQFSFTLLHEFFACINASLYYLEFLFKAMITEEMQNYDEPLHVTRIEATRLTNNNLDK